MHAAERVAPNAPPVPVPSFVRSLAGLGRLRAVLHHASGLAEVFCEAASLHVTPSRLDIVTPAAHVHLDLQPLTCARLLDPGNHAHPAKPSVVFYAQGGAPVLALVLDDTDELARARQHVAFLELRARFGAHVRLGDVPPVARVLH
jgi:hypothetical protein